MNTMSLSQEQSTKLKKLKNNFEKFENLAENFNEDVDKLGQEYNFNDFLTQKELKSIVDQKAADRIDLYNAEAKKQTKS